MRRRSNTSVGNIDALAMRVQIAAQLAEIGWRKIAFSRQRHRHVRNLTDIVEVVQWIKGERFRQRRNRRHADVMYQQRITIRRRAYDSICTYDAARTGPVLHHHGLTQRFAHGKRQVPSHHVRRATGGEWHEQGHCFLREVIGEGAGTNTKCKGQRGGEFHLCLQCGCKKRSWE